MSEGSPVSGKKVSRRAFLIGGGALVGVALSGCTPTPPEPAKPTAASAGAAAPPAAPTQPVKPASTQAPAVVAAAPKGTITMAQPRNISNIGALRHRTTDEMNLFFHLYDPLVVVDEKMALRPRLAESWERVDLNTWRFKLRKGVKFTNGEAFTAESAVDTITQYAKLDPPYYYVANWGPTWPPTAQVENESSILVKGASPCPHLPRLLTRFGMMPMQASRNPDYPEKPIASGPFRFVEWVKGQRIVFEANEGYWGGSPKFKQLIYRPILDTSARVAALEAGEIDVAYTFPAERIKSLPADKLTTLEGPSVSKGEVYYGAWRNSKSPTADVRVRRALTYAVDGKGIIEGILGSKAVSLKGFGPTMSEGSVDSGGFPARDVATAKRLLAEAGYGSGMNLAMILSPGEFLKDVEICEAIAGNLAEVGVDVKVEELESGEFSKRSGEGNWDLQPNGGTGWTGEAEFFIGSTKRAAGYSSQAVDKALEQASATMDDAARIRGMQQALNLIWEDRPTIFGFEIIWVHGISKKIKGARNIPPGWIFFEQAEVTS